MVPDKTFTPEQVVGIAFTAAGAATGPLLADHPHYVFPSERVSERVAEALREQGIEPNDFEGYKVEAPEVEVVPEMVSMNTITANLDASIRFWRAVRDGTQAPNLTTGSLTAEKAQELSAAYIDAFQSARVSLVGTTLDPEDAPAPA